MIAVAVQIMRAFYIDDHNDHSFNKKLCNAFAKRISVTKALKCEMFF